MDTNVRLAVKFDDEEMSQCNVKFLGDNQPVPLRLFITLS